jgi:hypothetical protein
MGERENDIMMQWLESENGGYKCRSAVCSESGANSGLANSLTLASHGLDTCKSVQCCFVLMNDEMKAPRSDSRGRSFFIVD